MTKLVKCYNCNGIGHIGQVTCSEYEGYGVVRERRQEDEVINLAIMVGRCEDA